MARINLVLQQRRKRRYKLRARSSEFIPDGDSDFANMARIFANHVARHADRFGIAREIVDSVQRAVDAFRNALAQTLRTSTSGPQATRRKNDARIDAEKRIRAAARILRADDSLTGGDRLLLRIPARKEKLAKRKCPNIAPVLRFIGSTLPDGSGPGRHILEYSNDFEYGRGKKPHGAVRLELFVELVPPEMAAAGKLPKHPAELSGGRLWFLRSFTTSRMEVDFPIAADGSPMLVVYWGRWCDAKGEFGRYSKTCVARLEGWSQVHINALAAGRGAQKAIEGDVLCDESAASRYEVSSKARYFIAERQVQERYMEQIQGMPPRQLEESMVPIQMRDERKLLDAVR